MSPEALIAEVLSPKFLEAKILSPDGLIIEVHHQPDKALSDGAQSIFPDQFDELMTQVQQIGAVVGRTVPEIGAHVSGSNLAAVGSEAHPV